MKRTVKVKNLIAFAAVLILLFSITAISASAIWNPFDTQRNRAFVAAALTALNIAFESQQMSALSIVDYIADPLELNYSYVDMWEDRPQIQIYPDYTTIDGKNYTDIWISNEAAEKFRVNAFDFITAYEIASQDNGTFASGYGTVYDIPLYSTANNSFTSQHYISEAPSAFAFGDVHGNTTFASTNYYNWVWSDTDGTVTSTSNNRLNTSSTDQSIDAYIHGTYNNYGIVQSSTGTLKARWNTQNINRPTSSVIHAPFSYDWVAQNIPADTPLPSDTGMMIRVPSADDHGNRYFDDFLIDYPEFDQDQPVTIDVNLDPDIMNKLSDLIDIIAPIIPVINNNFGDVQFIENHETPAPVPDTPIIDATVPQVINPIINEITNYGDQITEQIPNIIESIPNITEICNNIDTAPYHDLDTGLDRLPSFFLPFITDLRSALGIWHYVTEWLAQISTSFAFVSGCLVGTSIMTPIYAAIAGFMCIKIYRRMTA